MRGGTYNPWQFADAVRLLVEGPHVCKGVRLDTVIVPAKQNAEVGVGLGT